jgi:hypothetical protein
MIKRAILAIVSVATVVSAGAVVSAAGAAKTTQFTDTSVGASIGGNRSVAVVHDPEAGQGASVETVKLNGLSGTGRIITYWGDGTTTDVVSFKLTAPDSNGISHISGQGHQVAATGKFKGSKAKVTFSGTYDIKTTISRVTIKGTVTS